jgi:hypothetical protein
MNRHSPVGTAVVAERLPKALEGSAALRVLRRPGRPRKGVDAAFDLQANGISRPLWVDVETNPRPAAVAGFVERAKDAAAQGAVYLLASPALDGPLRRALREAGVSHADLAGSVFVTAPGIHVRVDAPRTAMAPVSARVEGSPFADRSSLVVRAMLREPVRAWGVRELAGELAISPALVSRTAEVMVRRGYAEQRGGKLALADPAAILVDWASVPPWRKNRVRSFVAPYEGEELRTAAARLVESLSPHADAVTQLAALDLYSPHVMGAVPVHAYCAPAAFETVSAGIASRLHAEPVRSGGNLHLVSPAMHRSTFFDARVLNGTRAVSPVQLFIDLCAYPLRGVEGAGMLLRSVLAPELGLKGEQVERITGFLNLL